MRRTHLQLALALSLAAPACSKCQSDPKTPDTKPKAEKTSRATEPAKPTPVTSPRAMPETPARPIALMKRALPTERAGTLRTTGQDARTVRAISLAHRCRDGFAVVPVLEDDAGALSIAEPFVFRIDSPPLDGKKHDYVDPLDPTRAATFQLTALGPERVQGSLRAPTKDGLTMELDVDAKPIPAVAAPGLGALGCYSTGFFSLTHRDETTSGWATARFEAPNMFEIDIPLDDSHALTILARIEPRGMTVGPFVDVDLATLFAEPTTADVRVFFETRSPQPLGDAPEILPYSGWERFPVEKGRLIVGIDDASWRPVLSFELSDVTAPEGYDGPLARGASISARAAARFVNPRQDQLATYPPPPPWWKRPARR